MNALPILFADDSMIAIAKPSGAVAHYTRGAEGAPVLHRVLADQLGQRVWLVHRLDRQTSGVMVFALSAEMASQMAAGIRAQRWSKSYLGLCRGLIVEPIVVDHPVPEDTSRRPARTEIEPVERLCERYTLVRLRPKTGRRHQLRYHLKHLRHPLVGDTNYGQGPINRFFRATFDLNRLFLHAERLQLPHPRSDEPLTIHCPLAPELQGVLTKLRVHQGPVA